MTGHSPTSSSADLNGITSDLVPYAWGSVEHLIKRAIRYSHGRYTLKEIYENLLTKDYQMWIVQDDDIKAVFVTSIEIYKSGKKSCNIILCAGKEVRKWLHAIDEIGQWAKENECDSLHAFCRPGWEKLVEYDHKHVLLERVL